VEAGEKRKAILGDRKEILRMRRAKKRYSCGAVGGDPVAAASLKTLGMGNEGSRRKHVSDFNGMLGKEKRQNRMGGGRGYCETRVRGPGSGGSALNSPKG